MDSKTTHLVHHPDGNRVGRVSILYATLHDGAERPMLRALFDLCRLVSEFPHECGRGQTFVLDGPLFDELAPGDEVPEYRVEYAWAGRPFTNPEHEQGCVRSGAFRFKAIRKIVIRVPPAALKAVAPLPG